MQILKNKKPRRLRRGPCLRISLQPSDQKFIPPMPPPPMPPPGMPPPASFFGSSATMASVVISSEATESAPCSAVGTTFKDCKKQIVRMSLCSGDTGWWNVSEESSNVLVEPNRNQFLHFRGCADLFIDPTLYQLDIYAGF